MDSVFVRFGPGAALVLSGISVLCFGASYAIALLLEVSRLFLRVPARTVLLVGVAAAGFLAHSAFLLVRLRPTMAQGAPLLNWYLGCLLLAWVLVLTYLLVFLISRRPTAGLMLLPTSLAMIAVAHLFPRTAQAVRAWSLLHGLALALGTSFVVIGFLAGLMYLLQSYRLKRKLPSRSAFWLPSLERLEKINERSLLASVGLLGLGLVLGILLNLAARGSEQRIPWSDPVVAASLVWLVWLFAVVLFHAVYRPARQGRKVAYVTVASFLFLGVVLGITRWIPSQHISRTRTAAGVPTQSVRVASPLPSVMRWSR